MGKLYQDLKKGLEEIIAYKEGKITLKSEIIQILEPPRAYIPKKDPSQERSPFKET